MRVTPGQRFAIVLNRRVVGMYLTHEITTRRGALRAGNRAGMLAGILERAFFTETTGVQRMSVARAEELARTTVAGQRVGPAPVPPRWRKIFIRAFVRTAIRASTTIRSWTVSSKYGVL